MKQRGNIKKNKWHYLWYVLITVLFFGMWFILNRLTKYTADDFTYKYVFIDPKPKPNLVKIHGIRSVIESQINHWKLWNGRFVAHTMVQYILQFKKVYFDVLNSIAVILLSVLVLKIGYLKSNARIQPVMYFMVLTFLYFFMPDIGTSVMWISGSGNYLWTSLIYLSYAYFFINNVDKSTGVFKGSGIILLAFISGACNENSSSTILLLLFLYMIYKWFASKEWNWTLFASLIFGGLGFILMMTSPGSIKRGGKNHDPHLYENNIRLVTNLLLERYQYLYLFVALLVFFVVLKGIKYQKDAIALSVLFFSGYFISAYVMAAAPEISPRTLFCSFIFLTISIVILMSELFVKPKILYSLAITGVGLFFLFTSYKIVYYDLKKTHDQVEEQYRVLLQSPKNTDVKVPLLTKPETEYNAYLATPEVSPLPWAWFNEWMSYYFGVKSITGYDYWKK